VPPKPLSFGTLHGGSTIRFLGSVYATAQESPSPYVVFFPITCVSFLEYSSMSTSESRTGGYDHFIFSHFVPYVQNCRFKRCLMSVSVKYMLCVCALLLQSCCFICSLMLVANMRCISCQFLSVMIYESSSHVFDFHMFHMIHDLACIFTMDIIDVMISMINISLYVIIMLLNYGIKMTWKLPIILTLHP